MKDIVFLGPSLPLAQARARLDADYRPPARMGDVYRASRERPRTITIVDGLFERTPAVWHKEVLHALDAGIAVFGAASMGALRAAELHAFGMRGVGEIYARYADGRLLDDDEVAVVHASAEDGWACASTAMINLRCGLEAAVRAGVLAAGDAEALLARSKARFYPERSWDALLLDVAALLGETARGRLQRFLDGAAPDQKRDDALAVLEAVAAHVRAGRAPARVPFVFEHTLYWETVESYFGERRAGDAAGVSFERVRNHVRLCEPAREAWRERALLLLLVEQEARRLGLAPVDDRTALARLRQRRGLLAAPALADWMERNGVARDECLALARLEARLDQLGRRHVAAVDRYLEAVLKLDGCWPDVLARVGAKWDAAAPAFLDEPGESADGLLAWYQQRLGRIGTPLEEHIAELGLGSRRQFLEELQAEFRAAAPPETPVRLDA